MPGVRLGHNNTVATREGANTKLDALALRFDVSGRQDGAVRSRLSGAGDVESLSTAYVIANLKKATKETSIMLLGRTGDDAKEVCALVTNKAPVVCGRRKHTPGMWS